MPLPTHSYIVLQAYGNEGIMQECVFALLTLCRQHTREELKGLQVWIYTDKPEFFRSFRDCWLDLRFREVDREQLRQWRGKIDFLHRVKIEVLRDFCSGHEGQVLYLDTDVCFTQPITTIFTDLAEGKLYMHIMEGLVHESGNVMIRKLSRFIKKNGPLIVDGNEISIPDQTSMWNAGVIGFHTRYSSLLEAVLKFTDAVYLQFHKHVVEQFAFSFYFQNAAPLKTAHTAISHYWNLKEIRFILASYFNYFQGRSWDDLVLYSRLIQLPEPMQQKVNFLQNRSTLNKFLKQQWQPEEPRWDLLMQQL
jgi:hypothetical protein